MIKLCMILGDQLHTSIPALKVIDKKKDLVFLCEVKEEATFVKHHPKKIAFLFSAMRHFAKSLTKSGYQVHYTQYDNPDNSGYFEKELLRIIANYNIAEIHITHPGEWRVLQKFQQLKNQIKIPLNIHEDSRFLCSIDEFKDWTKNKKQLRMEYFYRQMRQKYKILMDGNKPVGGSWNYDAQNRKNANHLKKFLEPIIHPNDEITLEVLDLVKKQFHDHFGALLPFNFAVTRQQALEDAHYFMEHGLNYFGEFQDAMRTDETQLFHSKLSFYLNAGLLLPLELCHMAEEVYKQKLAPLNSVEGFIRQILGWREYIRGIYWLKMPEYQYQNFFNATRSLPKLYWGQATQMFCLQEVVHQTQQEAYSHHIQRLMITGNFALLTGINPQEVSDWYLAVYADAYEWVELPNTLGMALYADGGLLASKPYAASGKYIHKMSNFCKSCVYKPNEVIGEKACPFNSLYWNFIHQHQDKLQHNPRMHYAYLNWNKMDSQKKQTILDHAHQTLGKLDAAGV